MKKRILYLLSVFFLLSASAFSSNALVNKDNNVLSPLSEKTYAKAPEPTPTLTNTPTPTPIPPTSTPEPTPTETPTPTPIAVTSKELDDLFAKYSNEYSVDKNVMTKIANCESGLNPAAATSLYAGLYQFSESLWVSTRTLMGHDNNPDLRFNAEEAIRTAAFMISQGNLGIWPVCSK